VMPKSQALLPDCRALAGAILPNAGLRYGG